MAVITGRLDVTTLAPVRGFPGAYLLAPVEASWQAVCDEVARRYGWRPTLTSAGDAYRSYAIQERLFRQRYTPDRVTGIDPRWWNGRLWWRLPGFAAAAVPGTSNHGRGDTVDVANLSYGTRQFGQFAEVATAHGWSNAEGRSVGEAWHWRCTRPAYPPLEDDMPTVDEVVTGLLSAKLGRSDVTVAQALQSQIRDSTAETTVNRLLTTKLGRSDITVAVALQRAHAAALTSIVSASGQPLDPAAVAAAMVPLLIEPLAEGIGTDLGMTVEQIQAATERAVRSVLGSLAD